MKSKIIKIILSVLLILFVATTLFFDKLFSLFDCIVIPIEEVYSPNKRYIAQYNDLGCNATVGFIQHVKIIDTQDPFNLVKNGFQKLLPGLHGAFFPLDGVISTLDSDRPKDLRLDIKWEEDVLIITQLKKTNFYRQYKQWQGVTIVYKAQ